MKVKLSDYIVQRLQEWGVDHVFMVTGGGAMHLNDSIGRPGGLPFVCTHHEQGATIAAEGYARVSGKTSVVCVTSGPGGTNALTGVLGCWTDSIPLLVLSGQVKKETCVAAYPEGKFRQLGDFEANIVPVARPITKYAHFVDDPLSIRYHLEKAYFLTTHERPGPCWLDIPVDIQASQIDPDTLIGFVPEEEYPERDTAELPALCREILDRIRGARTPIILAGSGIRHARAMEEFEAVARRLSLPVVLSCSAHDLLASGDPLRCGRAGVNADRAGNFVVANADLILVLGSRMGIRLTGYNYRAFAPQAHVVQVDIDPAELAKPTIQPDCPILADLKKFLAEMARQMQPLDESTQRHGGWLEWCQQRVWRYPGVTEQHRAESVKLNPYVFLEGLFERLRSDDIVVCGNGAAFIMGLAAGRQKKGQRAFFNSGTASMGYDLPASIGAAFAAGGRRVVCIAGDGSIQMNIQELQTLVHHQLPVKLVVLNNGGYLSIRTTQLGFFGNLIGESAASGVSFPDLQKLSSAYGIASCRIDSLTGWSRIDRLLEQPGPSLIEAIVDPDQMCEPRSASRQLPDGRIVSPPLEDMYPFLSREEMEQNVFLTSNSLSETRP